MNSSTAHCYNQAYMTETVAGDASTFNQLTLADAAITFKERMLHSWAGAGGNVTFLYDISGQYVRRDDEKIQHATYHNLARMFRMKHSREEGRWEVYWDKDASDPILLAFCHDDVSKASSMAAVSVYFSFAFAFSSSLFSTLLGCVP